MAGQGSQFGPYQIIELIGEGGMGRVYKARDTRLQRSVALKVPNANFSERFIRETKAISKLNHPRICSLFDVGPGYLVMEYIQGRPLRGPVPWLSAIAYATQILDALDAAHQQGIIHRDLKPANILVTASGIKLLDFGLAKVADAAGSPIEATQTQTFTTGEQTIVGTPAYMAPEQIEGKPVDGRTDVFAFGCVLYELLTGVPPFHADTPQRTIAAVLTATPRPLPEFDAAIPKMLAGIVETCLKKDPAERWQNVRDLRTALSLVEPAASEPRHSNKLLILAAVSVGLVVAALAAAVAVRNARDSPTQTYMLGVTPPEGTDSIREISISPDGKQLALAAGGRLWVRPLASDKARPIDGSNGAHSLFWSPDSRFIGFCADASLKRVAARDIKADRIAYAAGCDGAAWRQSRDGEGVIVFSPGVGAGLSQVSANGGTPRQITTLRPGENDHERPIFLPDGNLLYGSNGRGDGIFLARYSESGVTDAKLLIAEANWPVYVALRGSVSGLLVFRRDEGLLAQRFDYRTGTLSGNARPLGGSIPAGSDAVTAAQDGTVVFHSHDVGHRQVQLVNEYGSVITALSEPANYINLRLSPDASRVAVTQPGPEGSLDVYVHDIERRVKTRLTSNPAADGVPVWSPDGSEIAFASWRDGGSNLYVIAANGSGEEHPLLRSLGSKYPVDWSPDGAYLLFEVARPESSWDLWALPLNTASAPFPYVTTPANETDGRFSPDGHWVAYSSNETGQQEVYVQSFPAGKGKWRISSAGGGKPVWDRRGRTLYFLDPAGTLMAASISLGDHFSADKPVRQFFAGASYSTLGGQFDADSRGRFVVLSEVRKPTPTVVIGWRPELR